jgi:hypothetical protein
MKKLILFIKFICIAGITLCQNQTQSYDSSFRELYKTIALHPDHMDRRGIIHNPVIKRWDKDIKIFIEGGSAKSRKEILAKLKNTIAVISPALDNKIKISFTNDKPSANYLISLDFIGRRNGWYLKWDGLDNIYNCVMQVNTRTIFNRDQQAGLVSHYFLKSLGDFIFEKVDPPVVSNMDLWRHDINDTDLQILKLHYSDDIKPGMREEDIDKLFSHSK